MTPSAQDTGFLHVYGPEELVLPVEVLDRDLALVKAIRTGMQVDLPPGLYAVTAPLTDGTRFSAAIEIRAGERTTVEVSGPLAQRRAARPPGWWMDYLVFSQGHELVTRPEARSWQRRGFGRDPITAATVVQFTPAPSGYGFLFVDPGTADLDADPTLLALPAFGRRPHASQLEVLTGRPFRARVLPAGTTSTTVAMRLAEAGSLVEAGAVLDARVESDEFDPDPLAIWFEGYLRLRLGQPERVERLARQAMQTTGTLPDSLVLWGEYLRQLGEERLAAEAFAATLNHPPPVLSDSLSYLVAGLRSLDFVASELLSQRQSRYDALARLASRADLARVMLTVRGPRRDLLSLLATLTPPGQRLVDPAALRTSASPSVILGYLTGRNAPWRPAGLVGDLATEGRTALARWFRTVRERDRIRRRHRVVDVPYEPVAPARTNGKSWTWHPEAKRESKQLQETDRRTHALLAAKLQRLTAGSSRLSQAARGRIRQLPVVTDSASWVVLFVERRDGRGFGGLLLRRSDAKAKDPPERAYELSRDRLAELPEW